jgi:hypothetical protein
MTNLSMQFLLLNDLKIDYKSLNFTMLVKLMKVILLISFPSLIGHI